MTWWPGPPTSIIDGVESDAATIEGCFEQFRDSLNKLNGNNFEADPSLFGYPTSDVITHRSFHRNALVKSFEEKQLIRNEPATWLLIGRSLGDPDADTPDPKILDYSLGANENYYTVDGCSTRILINRDCEIRADAFVQIEGIKMSSKVLNGAAPSAEEGGDDNNYDSLATIDVQVDTWITATPQQDAGITQHGSSVEPWTETGGSRKVMRVEQLHNGDGSWLDYQGFRDYRRGFTATSTMRWVFENVPENGAYVDISTRLQGAIGAYSTYASVGNLNPRVVTDTSTIAYLFYAHLLSKSRGITVRVFQTPPKNHNLS